MPLNRYKKGAKCSSVEADLKAGEHNITLDKVPKNAPWNTGKKGLKISRGHRIKEALEEAAEHQPIRN